MRWLRCRGTPEPLHQWLLYRLTQIERRRELAFRFDRGQDIWRHFRLRISQCMQTLLAEHFLRLSLSFFFYAWRLAVHLPREHALTQNGVLRLVHHAQRRQSFSLLRSPSSSLHQTRELHRRHIYARLLREVIHGVYRHVVRPLAQIEQSLVCRVVVTRPQVLPLRLRQRRQLPVPSRLLPLTSTPTAHQHERLEALALRDPDEETARRHAVRLEVALRIEHGTAAVVTHETLVVLEELEAELQQNGAHHIDPPQNGYS